MIQLREVALPEAAQDALNSLQLEIDAIDDYAERVAAAKVQFSNQNRPTNPVFRIIREKLTDRMGHPTVWKEMQRQHRWIPELHDLFERAPEALDW